MAPFEPGQRTAWQYSLAATEVSVSDVAKLEGNSGSTPFTFELTRTDTTSDLNFVFFVVRGDNPSAGVEGGRRNLSR